MVKEFSSLYLAVLFWKHVAFNEAVYKNKIVNHDRRMYSSSVLVKCKSDHVFGISSCPILIIY